LKRLALRPSTNERQLVEVMRVTRHGGIEGDRWAKGAKRSPDNQITLMREDVARLLCPDDQIEIFGDNIFADVDLHADLLRVGSVLRIGSASLQVSPEPHDGCSKFKRRSVAGGLEFISQPALKKHRLRGIHLFVLEPGEFRVGDPIVVEWAAGII
jgi:MOSC domain-containing protein YiiM